MVVDVIKGINEKLGACHTLDALHREEITQTFSQGYKRLVEGKLVNIMCKSIL